MHRRLSRTVVAAAAVAGAILGAVAMPTSWSADPSPVARVAHERYIRAGSCGQERVSHVGAVGIVFRMTASDADRVARFVTDDPTGGGLTTAAVSRKEGWYAFPGMFGKDFHEEQWRETCEDGWCEVRFLHYPRPRGSTGKEAVLSAWLTDDNGEVIGKPVLTRFASPTASGMRETRYPDLAVRVEGETLRIDLARETGVLHLIAQIRDAAGQREVHQEVQPGNGRHETSARTEGPVAYLAALAFRQGGRDHPDAESKVELVPGNCSDRSVGPASETPGVPEQERASKQDPDGMGR
jgi:hypothetical protein